MSGPQEVPSFPTSLGTSTADEIRLLGQDLTADLMGKVGFGELAFWLVAMRRPTPSETRVFEAVLVALADHGFTPTAIAARLTYLSAPDSLQGALAADRAQTHIASVSPLGLVEMTRKRTRESLQHLLCAACPQCQGRGYVRTPETVSHEIFRELMRQSRQFHSDELVVLAHQDVVDWLQDEEAAVLAELETQVGRPIRLSLP